MCSVQEIQSLWIVSLKEGKWEVWVSVFCRTLALEAPVRKDWPLFYGSVIMLLL